jgi:uncharacterized membrane protein YhaH (DUF805 family)
MFTVMNKLNAFNNWFLPTGKRERLSFFLSNIFLILSSFVISFIFGLTFSTKIKNDIAPLMLFQEKSFSYSYLFTFTFIFLIGLYLVMVYIGIVFITQRLRDVGIKNIKVFILTILFLLVIRHITVVLDNNPFSTIIDVILSIFFLFLLFCPSNYLNRSSK